MVDIDRWIGFRSYGAVRDFFSRCPQAADVCFDYLGDAYTENLSAYRSKLSFHKTETDADGKNYWSPPPCYIKGERFVLIHFAPPANVSKDLCRESTRNLDEVAKLTVNSHFDEGPNLTASNHSVTMMATLDKIVFPAKTRLGYDHPDDEDVYFKFFGGTGAPYTTE
jgi:hypothetical protein